jgi:nucleoside 2-deoxyribosyltransferase
MLTLLLCSIFQLAAQDTGIRYLQTQAPLDMMGLRAVHDAVNNIDPNGMVYNHFDDQTILQFNVNPQITEQELREALAQNGIALRAEVPVIVAQQPVYTTPDGRPLYVLTGDDAADRERYENAVTEWNAAHPNDQIVLPLRAGEDQ